MNQRSLVPTMGVMPSVDEIRAARQMLNPYLPVTRLCPAPSLTKLLGAAVHLKLESDLPTGSFKPRGAMYALASRLQREAVREVVASSTGNHGAAVAYAASVFGVSATIFLPEGANPIKRARIAELGARIVDVEEREDRDAAQAARAHAMRTQGYFLHDATDPVLPAGPATIACEIFEQAPDTEAVVVPVGDTALIRGVAAAVRWLRPETRIIGVQAAKAPSYYLSWQEARVVTTASCDTIADGLATRIPESANVEAIRSHVDEMVLVTEDQMLAAMRHLLLEEHVVAEASGAAAAAAAIAGNWRGLQTTLLVTGANVSPEVLARVAAAT
ncbi:MAG: pyridoxal-phosphate dependent enzyme [Luteitalea sp.]|nr:pyridoxal-phosphate dependent enzyme [Luteitalea sp.]